MRILIFIVLFIPISMWSQEQSKDSIIRPYPRCGLVSIQTRSLAIRTETGFQTTKYAAIGVAKSVNRSSSIFFNDLSYYTGVTWHEAKGRDRYGINLGAIYNYSLLAAGMEARYQSNFKDNDFMIVPKVGIGLGWVNVLYGYVVPLNTVSFTSKERHQITIAIRVPLYKKESW